MHLRPQHRWNGRTTGSTLPLLPPYSLVKIELHSHQYSSIADRNGVAGPLHGIESIIERVGRRGRFFIVVKNIGHSIAIDINTTDVRPV